MSHMGTSHVGQMGCGSLEDVSALGTANILPVVSPFLTILMCGQPYSPASVRRYERDRRFHTGKSGFALSFQRQLWAFHFSSPPQWGQEPGSMSLGCTAYSTYRETRREQVWFNQIGRTLRAWAEVWFQCFRCPGS